MNKEVGMLLQKRVNKSKIGIPVSPLMHARWNATLDGQGICELRSGLTIETAPRSFLARKQLFLTRKIKRSSQRIAAVYKFRLHLRILYPLTEAAASLLEKLYAVGASYCGTR